MRIEAYVVVSDDDKITDHTGAMPDALKNDAEWEFFQKGMDKADVTVLGRRSHAATPNHRQRRRLVMTRSPSTLPPEPNTVFWNPDVNNLEGALLGFGAGMTHLAVVGGQPVFDFFLTGPNGYTAFHLSRVHGVTLPGGIGAFSAVDETGATMENVLRKAGYTPGIRQELDKNVDVVSWIPAA